MYETITVKGIVLRAEPFKDYDKRLVVFTKERGKITVFAKGVRRSKSQFLAVTNPFVFCKMDLIEGRNSYTLINATIDYNFLDLSKKQPEVYYGYYFLELVDYFTRDGLGEANILNLLYVSFLALESSKMPLKLIQSTFELRLLKEEGFMPSLYHCSNCNEEIKNRDRWYFSIENSNLLCDNCVSRETSLINIDRGSIYAMEYIISSSLHKLYSFSLNDSSIHHLNKIVHKLLLKEVDIKLKTLDILNLMGSLQ